MSGPQEQIRKHQAPPEGCNGTAVDLGQRIDLLNDLPKQIEEMNEESRFSRTREWMKTAPDGWASPASEKTEALRFRTETVVAGNGFVAKARIRGRINKTTDENGDITLSGVDPSRIVIDAGRSDDESIREMLHSAMRSIVETMAAEEDGFEAFKARVERFTAETDEDELIEWAASCGGGSEARTEGAEAEVLKFQTLNEVRPQAEATACTEVWRPGT